MEQGDKLTAPSADFFDSIGQTHVNSVERRTAKLTFQSGSYRYLQKAGFGPPGGTADNVCFSKLPVVSALFLRAANMGFWLSSAHHAVLICGLICQSVSERRE